jgi:ABC-type dipeptide/oligopeptide/nickel transport system permease subunit
VLSRIIFGARMSLYVSVTSVGIAAVIGVLLGIVAAWYRWTAARSCASWTCSSPSPAS